MKKIYTLFLLTFCMQAAMSQCPSIDGAMVNSCGSTQNNEGINEFVMFTTTAAATAGDYKLTYASTTPPATTPTNTLSGSTTGPKTGTGSFSASGGCVIHEVSSPTTVIPANSRVIFIPASFDTAYDVTSVCSNGNIYVVYITTTPNNSSASNWNPAGSFSNDPAGGVNKNRYLQISNGAAGCESEVRSYTSGWASNANGNFVSWDATGAAGYVNNGCTSIVTPVKLLSFAAIGSGRSAQVTWSTANEVNAKGFEVERSVGGINFTSIGTVEADGNSTVLRQYSFVDVNMPIGVSYYRLKMVDKDGTVAYSQVVRIVSTASGFTITNVFPKPAINQVGISWNSPKVGKTTALVYDYTGRLLMSQPLVSATGMNFYQLQVSMLPKGQYLLKLVKDKETTITRFSKL